MNVEKIDFDMSTLPYYTTVTVVTMGNTTEIGYVSRRNTKAHTIKLSKKEYLHVDTGEIKPYQTVKKKNRKESPDSVRKTFKRLMRIIQTNATDVSKIRWVTLTYQENMTDPQQLYKDTKSYQMRFNRYCEKHSYGRPEWIAVVEPQERGSFHWHIIYIFEKKAPFIPQPELTKIWGHGFVWIKQLKDTDNIARYLSAYLSDVEATPEEKEYLDESCIVEKEVDGKKKAFVKGARLHMYPANFKIYRCSKGIKKPTPENMAYGAALKRVKGMRKSFQSSYKISDPKSDFESIIAKAEFKKK